MTPPADEDSGNNAAGVVGAGKKAADGNATTRERKDHATQRLDKWLWYTRLIKTRSMATRLVSGGKVRVNKVKCDKPSQGLRCGDVVTATIGKNIRVLQVLELGSRRGPAPEARALYEDLAPLPERGKPLAAGPDAGSAVAARREPGSGRPTKRERRQTDRLRSGEQ